MIKSKEAVTRKKSKPRGRNMRDLKINVTKGKLWQNLLHNGCS